MYCTYRSALWKPHAEPVRSIIFAWTKMVVPFWITILSWFTIFSRWHDGMQRYVMQYQNIKNLITIKFFKMD